MSRPDARVLLMDAAERLFAEHGIATVSDRQVAEAAGNSNHSAVGYHFGGRAGLVDALLARHHEAVAPAQQRLFEESDSLLGDVRALVIPVTESFAALPAPSWRARFLNQAIHDPGTVESLRHRVSLVPETTGARVLASITRRLAHLDRSVVEGRGRLTAQVMSTACADIEASAERSGIAAPWSGAGDFLCDAMAGMLEAPVTRRDDA